MTKIVIPASVTSIDSEAFDYCDKLKSFEVDSANTVYTTTGGGVLFTKDVKTVVRYPRGRTDTSFTVPSQVTTIGQSAFWNCSYLKNINLPSNIETINQWAFCRCENVECITVPEKVSYVGKYAFAAMTNLKYVSINAKAPRIMDYSFNSTNGITDFTYNGSYTEWENSGWKLIDALNKDDIGNYLNQKVENKAFKGFTTSGTSLSIASFVTSIASGAFSENNSMASIGLPKSLVSYQVDVFDKCENLQSFFIDEDAANFKTVDGVLYSKDGKTLWRYPINKSGKSYTIASGVTKVGNSAFYKSKNLTSVKMPNTVVTLAPYAFGAAGSLESVNLSTSLATIDKYAFSGTSIAAFDLPSTVATVNKYAFQITKVTITTFTIRGDSKSATVDANAFGSSTKVTTVNYGGFGSDWDSSSWKTALDGKYTNLNYRYVIDSNGKLTDYLGDDEELNLPTRVKIIDDSAFKHTTKLKTLWIPSSVTSIGTSAFDSCKSLTKFTVSSENTAYKAENGVLYTKDGKTLFRYPIAKTATSFAVPSGVTTIEVNGFYYAKNLTSISLPDSLTRIGKWGINSCTKIKILTIPSSVTTVDKYAFGFMTSLTYLNINALTTTVDSTAFNGTSSIQYVAYRGTATQFGSSDWGAIDNVKDKPRYSNTEMNGYSVVKYTSSATNAALPTYATYIENNALPSTAQTLKIPKSLNGFSTSAFDSLSSLNEFTIESGNTTYSVKSGVLFSYDGKTLVRFPIAKAGTSYTIPTTTTTTIANSAFFNCTKVKEIFVPATVTKIENYAFAGPIKLTKLTIKCKNPTIASKAIGSSTFTTVDYGGTRAEWDASSWKTALEGKYTTLKLVSSIAITQQPKNQTITEGESVTVSVAATGNGLTYQWYFKKQGQSSFSEWKNRTNASETCNPNSTWNGIQLYCVIKDADGNTATTNTITVTVNSAPLAITTQPTNQYIILGKPVTVSLKATGSGVKYQWYVKKKGKTSFSLWDGRTHASETCTPNVSWDGIQLYCKVSDSSGNSINSNTITVSVLSIATQPKSQTIAKGSTLTISVKATGSGLTYQWYFKKKTQTSFNVWNGHTNAKETCVPNDTWDGIQLYCLVKDAKGNSVKSDTATITFTAADLAITKQPTNQYIILGKPVTVSLTATGNGLTYQWYFKKKGQSSFSVWSGRTHASETCTPNASWDGIQLYCIVKDSNGASKQSNTVTVSVLSISTQPVSQTIILGNPLTLSLKATGSGLTYQWYFKKTTQSSFNVWNGRTHASETCTPNATWNGIQLYCIVKDGAGNSVKSDVVTITVK